MQRRRIFIIHAYQLTDHRPSGDGLTADAFIRELAARGHDIHVASSSVDLRVPYPDNVTLHDVPGLRADGALARLRYMAGVRRLFTRLSREAPFDVAHQLNPVFTGLSLALIGTRTPIVLGTYVARWPESSHEGKRRPFARAAQWLNDRIAAAQQRRAAALLLTSPAARNRVPDRERIDAKMHVLPHGVDVEMFRPDPQQCPAHPRILFLANVWYRKGIFTLLDAFELVARALPEAELWIAGGGADLARVTARVDAMQARERVTLLGPAQRSEIPALLNAASVYCLPSYGEPYSQSALEAMACGLPLVVTDTGGLGHLAPESGSRKVPERDASRLAGALIDVLNSPQIQRSMGSANRAEAQRAHTWPVICDSLETVYDAVARN